MYKSGTKETEMFGLNLHHINFSGRVKMSVQR